MDKKLLVLGVLAVLALVLFGCTQIQEQNTNTGTDSNALGDTVLTGTDINGENAAAGTVLTGTDVNADVAAVS